MIAQGNALAVPLSDESIHCVVTSPPYYGLRDYGVSGQLGLEATPDEYVNNLVSVFRELRRVLRKDGVCWLNLGDSYAADRGYQVPDGKYKDVGNSKGMKAAQCGLKPKDLIGIPWRVAFALQADGWWLRSDIIWAKPNPMPESVTDRPTRSHEYIFLLTKSARYWYDNDAIREEAKEESYQRYEYGFTTQNGKTGDPKNDACYAVKATRQKDGQERFRNLNGRNARSVWTIATQPFKGAHFATFPQELAKRCILAGCPPGGRRCDCDEVINSPTGNGPIDDPSMVTGRAGMNRPRRPDEGTRPITRREQRWEAGQMKQSPHRDAMERICGDAFAHYIRTDDSGARPLPEAMRADFMERGWITQAPPCEHPIEPPGLVLDPFSGSGTTVYVAHGCGRKAIGLDLSTEYCQMAQGRNGFL